MIKVNHGWSFDDIMEIWGGWPNFHGMTKEPKFHCHFHKIRIFQHESKSLNSYKMGKYPDCPLLPLILWPLYIQSYEPDKYFACGRLQFGYSDNNSPLKWKIFFDIVKLVCVILDIRTIILEREWGINLTADLVRAKPGSGSGLT